MKIGIYTGIIILFVVLILWTWNNTKDFQSKTQRIIFMIIGMSIAWFITNVIFNLSKIGIVYPNKEILGEVRRIIILVFIPINGFVTLPYFANLLIKIKNNESISRKILIYLIIFIIAIIIEYFYLKDFQIGLLKIISKR